MTHEQIIRAWKDEDYRHGLSGEELSALPAHPAGLVELSDENLVGVAGLEEDAWTKRLCDITIQVTIAVTVWITQAVCLEDTAV